MDETKLRSIPLFSGLSKKELREVARHADEVDVPEGKALLQEGSTPSEFFAIEEGSVEVRRDADVLAKLGPGDFFGETAGALPSVAPELRRAVEERCATAAAKS